MMQGDPRLVLGPDGSRLVFYNGQPVMDSGLENLALISLFTSPGWCGNNFLTTPIGSDFETVCNQPITRTAINQIRNSAERALADPIFGKVSVIVRNPTGYRLEVGILIRKTGAVLILVRNASSWYYQTIDPASRRLASTPYSSGTLTVLPVPGSTTNAFNETDIPFNLSDWEFNN